MRLATNDAVNHRAETSTSMTQLFKMQWTQSWMVKNMNPKFYDKKKAMAWLESIGGEPELARRLKFIQSKKPPTGAPPRNQMPVIDADSGEDKTAATLLKRGSLDVRPPYAKVR